MTAIFSYVNDGHRASGFENEGHNKMRHARRSRYDRRWTGRRSGFSFLAFSIAVNKDFLCNLKNKQEEFK